MADEIQPKSTTEYLKALVDQFTVDQVRFIVARQEHGTDKAAAEAIGISPDTVKRWKYDGVLIDDAVKAMAADGLIVAQTMRRRNLAKAMLVKVAGLDETDSKLRQAVATEIIEWEMGRATQKQDVDVKSGGERISIPTAEDVAEALRILGETDSGQGGGGA